MSVSMPTGKIQIVSRYAPAENRAGHFTYVLDVMRCLHRAGHGLELVVLDPWCQVVPPVVRELAQVVIMPSPKADPVSQPPSRSILQSWFRPLYRCLPQQWVHVCRESLYRWQGKSLPGIHAHDAAATPAELSFITRCYQAFRPDVLIANQTYLGNIFSALPPQSGSLHVILTIHIEHQRTQDFQQIGFPTHDSLWDRATETRLLQQAHVLLAVQKEDAEILRQLAPQSEVICTPMSATFHPHSAAEQVPGRCIFVASAIDHNVYGLRWFLAQVWPLVQQRVPASTLHVCGSVCRQIAGTYPQVTLLGRVEDVHPEYAAAEVCLIPLPVGSGLKIKLVEALSHGRACVSTSIGLQGVQELTDQAVLVANTPKDFAQALVTIFRHPEQRQAMEAEARRYVIEHLSPEKAYQPFLDRIFRHMHQDFK